MAIVERTRPAGQATHLTIREIREGRSGLWLVAWASVAAAQATDEPLVIRDVRFTVDAALAPETLARRLEDQRQHSRSPIDALCGCLLDVRRIAETEGRLDFSAMVEVAAAGGPIDVTAHVRMGSAYAVGRIDFTGHHAINDSTLRRAMTLRERDLFDVRKLRRSQTRLNDIGLIEPLTLTDVSVTRNVDGPRNPDARVLRTPPPDTGTRHGARRGNQ